MERTSKGKAIYTHSPFSLEHKEFKVSCSESGVIKLEKNVTEAGEEISDVIDDIPAILIIRIAKMLEATRTVTFRN